MPCWNSGSVQENNANSGRCRDQVLFFRTKFAYWHEFTLLPEHAGGSGCAVHPHQGSYNVSIKRTCALSFWSFWTFFAPWYRRSREASSVKMS